MLRHRFQLHLAVFLTLLTLAAPLPATAQGTLADYIRADSLGDRIQGLVLDVAETPSWVGESNRFWYRNSVEGGNSFVLVDATTQAKGPAFDHIRLAAALAALPAFEEDTVTAVNLPFNRFEFTDDESAIEFSGADSTWHCELEGYECESRGPAQEGQGRRGFGVGPRGFPGRPDPASSGGI